jgi:hypothetical protein
MVNSVDDKGLTFEEVLEILEEELLSLDFENPYRPLDFNDTDEGYEE